MTKNIRGYSIEIAVTIFKHRICINFLPLKWRFFYGVQKINGHSNWHLFIAPFHIWHMVTGGLFSIEIDLNYDYFWDDALVKNHVK